MKPMMVAVVAAAMSLTAQARAADPELQLETKRMLAYGTLAVMVGGCKTPLTPAQSTQLNTGLTKASEAQHQLSEAEFTDMMKAVGAQVGSNRDQVCAALTPEFIDTSLAEAEAGE